MMDLIHPICAESIGRSISLAGVADLQYEGLNMQILKTIVNKASGFLPGSFSSSD
ncbi:MAG: hypothetical protein JGK01_28685 [Microcoleus sp. PH2017_03_ELD_O_A]|nr:hypothetical protein [Microcoleus sp. PH2017_03_ELD_O_A]